MSSLHLLKNFSFEHASKLGVLPWTGPPVKVPPGPERRRVTVLKQGLPATYSLTLERRNGPHGAWQTAVFGGSATPFALTEANEAATFNGGATFEVDFDATEVGEVRVRVDALAQGTAIYPAIQFPYSAPSESGTGVHRGWMLARMWRPRGAPPVGGWPCVVRSTSTFNAHIYQGGINNDPVDAENETKAIFASLARGCCYVHVYTTAKNVNTTGTLGNEDDGGIAGVDGGNWRLPTDPRSVDTNLPKHPRDFARAIQTLRARAEELEINPDMIFLLSAGVESMLVLTTFRELADPSSSDPVLRQSCVPNGWLGMTPVMWWPTQGQGVAPVNVHPFEGANLAAVNPQERIGLSPLSYLFDKRTLRRLVSTPIYCYGQFNRLNTAFGGQAYSHLVSLDPQGTQLFSEPAATTQVNWVQGSNPFFALPVAWDALQFFRMLRQDAYAAFAGRRERYTAQDRAQRFAKHHLAILQGTEVASPFESTDISLGDLPAAYRYLVDELGSPGTANEISNQIVSRITIGLDHLLKHSLGERHLFPERRPGGDAVLNAWIS